MVERFATRLTSAVEYEDRSGRKWVVLVPKGQEHNASRGIPVGPPDTSDIGLPEHVAIELHNQLFNRGLITKKDLAGRAMEVHAALNAALKVDAQRIMNLYT